MKKLLLSLLFALVALTGLQAQTIWDGTADTSWYDETSTEFEISTAEQLAGLAELVNNGNDFSGKTILITADIVLNDTSNWENWESSAPNNTWTPIGANWNNLFCGTFDGQGHTVSGIYINSENYYQGLFGKNSGTIKNAGVTESYIKGDYYVGGVCGYNYVSISDCYNSGTVSGNSYIGGVCGVIYVGKISNCHNSGEVSGNDYVGGVCGVIYYSYGTTSNCYYLEGTATGGINGSDARGRAEAKTAKQFASGEVCWLLNEKQSDGAWGQKIGTDPCPVLGGPAVFKDGETYYNEEGSAIVETNSEQASFVIVSENLTINIYGSDHEATVYNLAGNIVYKGSERIIPVTTAGMYLVRIGNEVQKTVVR